MNKVLVIIPTYNEIENVPRIAPAVLQALPDADLLFVDDHSPDGTGALIEALCAQHPRIHHLAREGKQGLGRAYIAGFRWAIEQGYDFIFEMDADFSHRPEDLPRFLAAMERADLVLGSRYLGGVRVLNWPLSRLLLSRGAGLYVRLILGLPFSDPTGGFKCYRRSVLESIDLNSIASNGYSFQIELTHRAWLQGFRIEEIPIVFEERRQGHSKMNMSIVREALGMVWKLAFQARLRRRPFAPNARHARAPQEEEST